jgi:hypothetical protein
MHPICLRIYKAYRISVVEFRRQQSEVPFPFWKLGLHEAVEYSPECLRLELCDALINGEFDGFHIPAFLTFVQTHAAGHSYRLWEETVIPLLSGTGAGQRNLRSRLREVFDREYPFRSSMRNWLSDNHRSQTYLRDGSYFWFVRAVIGECALAGISKEFAEIFLGGLFREPYRNDELREIVQQRFHDQIQRFGKSRERIEVESIKVLEDCLVEAGLVVLEITRFLKTATPQSQECNVDELLEKCQKTRNVRPGTLPPLVIEIIRKRVCTEITKLSLEQLLAVLRRAPGSEVRAGKLTWKLSDLEPPPVTIAEIWHGTTRLGVFELVDDIGRCANELLRMANTSGWEVQGDLVWKLSSEPFTARHPSRLRSRSRPVIRSGENYADAVRWVLTLPQKEFASTQEPVRDRSRRSFLKAWPSIDRECRSTFFVRSFFIPADWVGQIRLEIQEPENDIWSLVWEGPARRGEVILRRSVAATPGQRSRFRLSGELECETAVFREVKFDWPLPALYLNGRRIPEGPQLAPAQGNFSLFCCHVPEIRGGNGLQNLPPRFTSSNYRQYEFNRQNNECLSVQADGKSWEILSNLPITLPARLEPAQTQERRPELNRYTAGEGIDVFFKEMPSLVVELHANGASDAELESLVRRTAIMAGNEDDPIGFVCGSLSDFILEPHSGLFRISLSEIMPNDLINPGFDVRWVRLLDGSIGNSSNDFGVIFGQEFHFLVLPHTSELVFPRRPGACGELRLEDPSNIFAPLIMREPGGAVIPISGTSTTPRVRVGTTLSFLDRRIEALLTFPLCGCWFSDHRWTLADLVRFLGEQPVTCGILIVPQGQSVVVRLEDLDGFELAIRTIDGPCSREITFDEICPISTDSDEDLQCRWLSIEGSRITCKWNEGICGQVALDHRGIVTEFLVVDRQGPDAIGVTNVVLEISFLMSFCKDGEFALVLTQIDEDLSIEIDRRTVLLSGVEFEISTCREAITIPSAGNFRLELRSHKENSVFAFVDIHVENPGPEPIPLEELLEYLPEPPGIDHVILVYRHIQMYRDLLRGKNAPWCGCTCYSRLDGLWHSSQTGSRVQLLIGILRAYSDGLNFKFLGPVPPVTVDDARGEAFLEIATVMMHLYFNTDAALRHGLETWECELERFSHESQIDAAARGWSELLLNVCRKMQNKSARKLVDDELWLKTWFPCRPEFLSFFERKASLSHSFNKRNSMMDRS